MKVLVDTSLWSLALRRKAEDVSPEERRASRRLSDCIQEGRAELLGPVRQELLSGLREQTEFVRLRDYLRDFPDVELSTEDYEEAASLSNRCRRRGIASSATDMLLCAVAVRRGWQIFTTDRDFLDYGRILPVRLFPQR
ncbi:MAG TPA: PIN domain-containing protein [Candidatus Sulfotelmatobacter sp.]|nr:PIN domain-containing protein [Candidatus Sulfotelmatobacter sp.]